MDKVAAIVGPTAVGKTNAAIRVAREINGEILSCDSMQVYRGMDIGTAKASKEEQAMVPHHLLDIVEADQDFSVAQYQKLVKGLITELNQQDKVPILVGGTGLYYQAVVDNYPFYPMKSRQLLRDKWNNIIEQKGLDEVYQHLKEIDPDYAGIISSQDQKRIVRALEVYELTGQPFSAHQKKYENTYNLAAVGLYLDRQELYARIDERVDKMIQMGLIDEVQSLREKGFDLSTKSMQALGYKQIYYYLEGFINRDDMINEIKRETRRYAKRQYTWFKKDKRIHWINVGEFPDTNQLGKKISFLMEGLLSEM